MSLFIDLKARSTYRQIENSIKHSLFITCYSRTDKASFVLFASLDITLPQHDKNFLLKEPIAREQSLDS